MTSGAGGSGEFSQETFERLVGAMDKVVTDKMGQLKRELTQEQEEANDRLAKRMRLERPTFKKKTHEKQHHFNEEVRAKVAEASDALAQTPAAVEKAKSLLEEGEKLILDRQKLIRIADRSENGWATVEEYMEDELADNSDDEKRIQKAEFRAGRKLKAAAATRQKKKPFAQSGLRAREPAVLGQGGPANHGFFQGASWKGGIGSAYRPTGPMAAGMNWYRPTLPVGRVVGPCWHCGKEGHFRSKCPLLCGPKQ